MAMNTCQSPLFTTGKHEANPRRMRSRRVSMLCLLGLISGCDGGGEIPPGSAGSAYAQALCHKTFECCTDTQLQKLWYSRGNDENECRDLVQSGYVRLAAAVERKRATYDATLLVRCIDGLRTVTCDGYAGSISPECAGWLQRHGVDGDPCLGQLECASDFFCTASNGVEGICERAPSLGQACYRGGACAFGFWCDPTTTTCATQALAGESCQLDVHCVDLACDTSSNTCADTSSWCTGRT